MTLEAVPEREHDGEPQPIRLALKPREAAAALGISERLLWSKTNAGEIPHVRIGKSVRYSIASLREFLAEKTRKGAAQ